MSAVMKVKPLPTLAKPTGPRPIRKSKVYFSLKNITHPKKLYPSSLSPFTAYIELQLYQYVCKLCKIKMNNVKDFLSHAQLHPNTCVFCNDCETSMTLEDWIPHHQAHKSRVVCRHCRPHNSFPLRKFADHLVNCREEISVTCLDCNIVVEGVIEISKHLSIHEVGISKFYFQPRRRIEMTKQNSEQSEATN